MKRKIIIAGVLLTSTIALISGIENNAHEVHSDCEFTYVTLEKTYEINKSLSIPGGFVEIDGNSYISNHILTYPSGKKSYSSQVVLDEAGNYKLEYYYVLDGKYYSETQTFVVVSPAFSLGPNSSAYYGVVENSSTPGLIVNLGVNEELVFNQTINVNTLFENNRFIETFVAPFTKGVADFDTLIFTLTNPINPNEYIKFRVSSSISEPRYVALADVSVQGNGTDYIGEEFYNELIHHNDGDGTKVDFSFRGQSFGYKEEIVDNKLVRTQVRLEDAPYDSTRLRLNFDYPSKSVYVYNPYRAGDGSISSMNGPGPMRVVDLDDPKDVGYRPWNGFSSDYVKISVSGEEYSNSTARFVISELYGIDLKSTQLSDINVPTLRLDNQYGNNMPLGKIGYKYRIPNAYAEDDIDGKLPVKINVWKDYEKPTCSSVEIIENYFIPKSNGNYTIVYSCEDHSGNVSSKTLKVTVSDSIEPIVISVDESIFASNHVQGKNVVLPSALFNGGSGDLSCKISAKLGDYEEIINEDNLFCPELEGKWEIKYVVTDFLGQEKSKTVNLNVLHSNLPILQEEFLGDKYIVCYSEYKIPEPKIVDYVNNEKISPEYFVDVTLNSQKTRYKKGDVLKLDNVQHGAKITFDYIYNESILATHEAKIVNPYSQSNEFLIEKYFMSEDATICYDDGLTNKVPNYKKGVKVVSKGNPTTSFDFANYCLSAFNFKFTIIKNHDNFESIDIILKDAENKKISVTLKITKSEDGYYIQVPGKTPVRFANLMSEEFLTNSITYSNNSIIIGDSSIPLSVDDNGKEFKWFPSNRLSVSLCANKFENGNYLYVNTVGNHDIISSILNPYDYTAPQLCLLDDIRGIYKIGDVVKTSRVITQDVAALNSVAKVSVVDKATGNYIKDVNGVEIKNLSCDSQYTIKLDQYRDLKFVYSVSESNKWRANNKFESVVTISCVKKDGPKISFTTYFPETVEVNSQVKLPQYEVSDINGTSSVTVFRYFVKPSGNVVTLSNYQDSYTFTEKGVYNFCVAAMDQFKNITVATQFVKVI